ncbi:MAG: hypothetical protein R3D63_03985 [Paracoccaceae bacterium]
MRPARSIALLVALAAGPAGAGCFGADEMPARAVYDHGRTVEYLSRDGDVLTYRSGDTTSKVKDGIWPLEQKSPVLAAEYRWDGLLPDLARVRADGGMARAEGRMRQGGAAWVPILAEIEILGEDRQDWEDCRYEVVEFRRKLTVDGHLVSDSVLLFAPGAMIAFRSDTVDPITGEISTQSLIGLN